MRVSVPATFPPTFPCSLHAFVSLSRGPWNMCRKGGVGEDGDWGFRMWMRMKMRMRMRMRMGIRKEL